MKNLKDLKDDIFILKMSEYVYAHLQRMRGCERKGEMVRRIVGKCLKKFYGSYSLGKRNKQEPKVWNRRSTSYFEDNSIKIFPSVKSQSDLLIA